MPMIRVPLEVHAITVVVLEQRIEARQIRVGPTMTTRNERVTSRREVPPRQDRTSFDSALRYSNNVFAPADIQFYVAAFAAATEEIPNGAEQVDFNGFQYLVGRFPPTSGLSVLLVADFERERTSAARRWRLSQPASSARSATPAREKSSRTSLRT